MPPKRKSVQLVLTEPAPKNKGGRPQDPVWVHFIQTPLATAGHFAAECKYCKKNGLEDDHKTFNSILLEIVLKFKMI